MSKTIDERVVSMQFDNKHFESNVQTTMSTLDKLKQKLRLDGASKGLENVNSASKKIDMSGLGNSVEAVRSRFSALEVMGVTALANITNSAVNAGKRIVSALTIDPVRTGFQEYETQINAVQTILANTKHKGSTLEDVNKALDELNEYADLTIYNFTEMTKNIGLFTNAGVGLDDSVAAIKGFSNAAAMSGADATRTAGAMYQLSQAMSAGVVQLMDWRSLTTANIGGERFQDVIKETARAHGIAIDDMIAKEGTFQETLKNKWLTADLMAEALNHYTLSTETMTEAEIKANKERLRSLGYTEEQIEKLFDIGTEATNAATKIKTFTQMWGVLQETAQSGWAKTWQIIFGDFEEAKNLFTPLTNTLSRFIEKMSDARNKLLEGALGKSFKGIAEKINGVVKPAKEAAKVVKDLGDIVDRVLGGEFGNGEDRFNKLTEAGYNYYKVQNKVNETLGDSFRYSDDLVESQEKLVGTQKESVETSSEMTKSNAEYIESLTKKSDAELKSLGYTKEQIEAIRELKKQSDKLGIPMREFIENIDEIDGRWLLINSLKNAGKGLVTIFQSIGKAWREIFDPITSDQLFNVIAGIHKFSTYLVVSDDTAKKLKRTLKGLFAILDIVRTVAGGAFRIAFRIASEILGLFNKDILSVTASIGDVIVKFRDWLFENNLLVKGLEKLVVWVKNGISLIRDWFNRFRELPIVQQNITRFKDAASDTFGSLKEHFSGGIKVISEFIDRVKNMDGITVENIKSVFKDFKDNVISYFFDIGGCFDGAKEAINKFKEDVKKYFEESGRSFDGFKEKITGIVDFIKEKFSNINLGSIFTIAIGAGFIFLVKKISDGVGTLFGVFDGVGDILTNFATSIGSVGKVLRSFALNVKTKSMINIAIAIAILVGSIAVLTLLDPGKLWESVGVLAVVSTMLIGITTALGFVGKQIGGLAAASVAVLSIGATLLLFVWCMKIISGMSPEDVTKGLAVVGALEALIVGLIAASNLAGHKMGKIGVMIIKIGIALMLLVGVMKLASGMSADDIFKGLVVIAALEALIVGLIAASNLAGHKMGKIGGMVAKIGIALLILVGVMKIAASMSPEDIFKGLVVIAALEALVIGLIAVSKLAGKNVDKIGGSIAKISVALLIMVVVMKIVSTMSPEDLFKGIIVIAALEALVVALIAVSKLAGKHADKAGSMIMKIGVAFLLLAVAMGIISMLDPDGIGKAILAIAAISACFAGLIAVSKLAKDAKSTIIALSIAIAVMAIALAGLSMIDPNNLAAATASLSIVTGVFAALVASTKFINTNGKEFIKTIAVLAVLTLVVASLAIIIKYLAEVQAENAIGSAVALSTLLLSLSAVCVILQFVRPSAALTGVIGLAAVVGGIALLLTALGGLAQIPGLEWLLGEGTRILGQIGTAIGTFVGNIVGGVMAGVTSGLPEMGKNLSDFMTNVQPFIDGAKNIDESVLKGVAALAGAVLAITAADVISGLASRYTGGSSIVTFGEDIASLGPNLKAFADSVDGIDPESVKAAASAAKALAEMANTIPNEGGVVGWFAGENSIANFGTELVSFGTNLKAFSDNVVGIDPENIKSAASAAKALAEMANTIPNEGGVVSWFTGDNSLSSFGPQIASFGTNLKAFSDNVSGINPEDVVAAANAGKALAEMANTIPNEGGVVSWFTGENSITKFGTEIALFGSSLKLFSDNVAGINPENVTVAANAGKTLAEMTNTIPNEGGVVGWWNGENSLGKFGTEIASFGLNIKEFSKNVEGINPNNVTAAANAAKALAEMTNIIPNEGGVVGWWGGEKSLSSFGDKIASFGESIKDFSDNVAGIKPENVTAAANAGKTLAEMTNTVPEKVNLDTFGSQIKDFGKDIKDFADDVSDIKTSTLTDAVKGIKEVMSSIKELAKNGISGFTEEFKNGKSKVKTAVSDLITAINDAAKSKETSVENAFKAVGEKALSAVKNFALYNDFYSVGSNLVDGFANGITANTYKAEARARAMAANAYAAAKEELDVNSPSKVFRKLGTSVPEGFAMGIDKLGNVVNDSSTSMARMAINGTKGALSNMLDLINSDVDAQPTIRPVLDLTDVASGVGMIDGLFRMRPSVGVLSNVNSISSMMNRNQNGANDDVISAIKDLGRKIGSSGDTYQINGITYDDGSNVSDAIRTLVRAARVERRM